MFPARWPNSVGHSPRLMSPNVASGASSVITVDLLKTHRGAIELPWIHSRFAETTTGELALSPKESIRLAFQSPPAELRIPAFPKRPERLFLQLLIHKLARGYEIREQRAAKSQTDHFD